MSGSAAPVTVESFRDRLSALGAPRRIIVAVSGGTDSMALARLCASLGGDYEPLAVTVDHGLQPASRDHAQQAGAWCRAAGLEHRILEWTGDKPATGVQEAARKARYRLLSGLAARERFGAVLTAHTADDQAETVVMRLARGAGPRGLSAMAARSRIASGAGAPVLLLRPLLDATRHDLETTLEAYGQPALHDPANDDPGFERIRIRALLAALAEQGLLTRAGLVRSAARAERTILDIEAFENDWFARSGGGFDRYGRVCLPTGDPPPASLAARLVHAVSGAEQRPDEADAADAAAQGGSLGGCLLRRDRKGLWVYREPAAVLGRAGVAPLAPIGIGPGERTLWDNRFIIENRSASPVSILPLGREASRDGGGPPDSLAAAPAIAGASQRLAADVPGILVSPLSAERFFDKIVRFS